MVALTDELTALKDARARRFERLIEIVDLSSVSSELFEDMYALFETQEQTGLRKADVIRMIAREAAAIDANLTSWCKSRRLNCRLGRVIESLSETAVAVLLDRVQLRLLKATDGENDMWFLEEEH